MAGAISAMRSGLVSGFVAGAAILATSALVALMLGFPILTELWWDEVVGVIPGPLFSAAVDIFKFWAKPLLLLGLTALQVLAAGALGVVYALACRAHPGLLDYSRRRPWLVGGVFGAALGLAIPGIASFTTVGWRTWLITTGALFAFAVLQAELAAKMGRAGVEGDQASSIDMVRRSLLLKLIVVLVASSSLGLIAKVLLSSSRSALGAMKPAPGRRTSYLTPNAEFYHVSKNLRDPVVDARSWRLEVKGLVSNPLTLTLEDLKSLPSVAQPTTLECISNEVGGDLVGNAIWRGVSLRDLLLRAGVSPEARDIALSAADGYSDSIPLEKALYPGTLIAYEMNGEPLPDGHGFPARLVVPGIYGMKNVKWLTSIEPVAGDYQGFWQAEGWSDKAIVRTTSRIDTHLDGSSVGGDLAIAGVAFAGDRGISKVEVSFDSVTWQPALLEQTLSPYTWVLWALDAQFSGEGRRAITVRAVDGQGDPQEANVEASFPNGATGHHRVTVTVVRQ